MPWFVKIEQGIVDKSVFDQYVPAHLAYVNGLIRQGYRAKTGYWRERGGGMLLFQASDLSEAKAIIAQTDDLMRTTVATHQLLDDFEGSVCRAIVRKNDLQGGERLRQGTFDRRTNVRFLIVSKHDKRNEWSIFL